MKSKFLKCGYAFSLLFGAQFTFAQSGSGTNWFLTTSVAIGIILLVGAIISLTDNLMQVEAAKSGVDTKKENYSIFPRIGELFGAKAPSYVDGNFHKLNKGFDIKLEGAPHSSEVEDVYVSRVAIQPQDFLGISPIPKVVVEVGDEVLAGQPLFFDKKKPEIQYASPVSGEVVEVVRGAKRSIAQVIILADKEIRYAKQDAPNVETAERSEIVDFMAASGAWPLLNQRPFDVLPELDAQPKNIFISTFDTAPLAPDTGIQMEGRAAAFQKGLDVLGRLTEGKVYLGLDANGSSAPSTVFTEATGVEKNWFKGKHPSGNVGVQIHHTAPINAGDSVWTLNVQEVAQLGELFLSGKFDASRVVSLSGAELEQPKYVRTYQGASISDLLKGNIKDNNYRVISGNVLTGKESSLEGFLNFRTDQVTVVLEGDQYEMFGWLLPIKPRPSMSRTFPAFLMPNHKYEANTNTHGEKRALVQTGQYEAVLPMDIYPQHLVKAILTGDFERMEGLGIMELTEEDLALCEFVCTSKTPVQQILRDGLNMVREQM